MVKIEGDGFATPALAQLYQLGEKSEQHQGIWPGGLHYIR